MCYLAYMSKILNEIWSTVCGDFILFSGFRSFLGWITSSLSRWPGLPAKKENVKRSAPSVRTRTFHRLVTQSSLIQVHIYCCFYIFVFLCMLTLLHLCHFPQAPWMQICSVESALGEEYGSNREYLLREITYSPAAQNLSRDALKNVLYSSGCIGTCY